MNTVELASGVVDQTARTRESGPSAAPPQQPSPEPKVEAPGTGAKQESNVNEQELGSVVESLNALAQAARRRLEFSVDQDSGRTVIKIMDFDTQELIRQIPPEELLRLSQHMHDAQGLLIDAEA